MSWLVHMSINQSVKYFIVIRHDRTHTSTQEKYSDASLQNLTPEVNKKV